MVVQAKETGTEWGKFNGESDVCSPFENSSFLGEQATLPEKVMEWSGLKEPNPYSENWGSLASLNDEGKEFPEIADIIEEFL